MLVSFIVVLVILVSLCLGSNFSYGSCWHPGIEVSPTVAALLERPQGQKCQLLQPTPAVNVHTASSECPSYSHTCD